MHDILWNGGIGESMKINKMNEYVNWFLIGAIGCTICNIFLFIVLFNFEELEMIQGVLVGLTVLWWVAFLILYIKDRNTLLNPQKIEGIIIGESFKVVFLGKSELIVRAKVISSDGQVFHSYTGIYLLDYIKVKKEKIHFPCTIIRNKKRKKSAIIYFRDAVYNTEQGIMNIKMRI